MFLAFILVLFLFLGLLVLALVKQNKPTFIAAATSFILLLVLAIVGIRNGISKLSKHVKKGFHKFEQKMDEVSEREKNRDRGMETYQLIFGEEVNLCVSVNQSETNYGNVEKTYLNALICPEELARILANRTYEKTTVNANSIVLVDIGETDWFDVTELGKTIHQYKFKDEIQGIQQLIYVNETQTELYAIEVER
jgi:hypothetical protein